MTGTIAAYPSQKLDDDEASDDMMSALTNR